ncbi:hypothetical protein AOLI_G00308610 [Acnodon oligacanthus]
MFISADSAKIRPQHWSPSDHVSSPQDIFRLVLTEDSAVFRSAELTHTFWLKSDIQELCHNPCGCHGNASAVGFEVNLCFIK